jgi:hypothetical protein
MEDAHRLAGGLSPSQSIGIAAPLRGGVHNVLNCFTEVPGKVLRSNESGPLMATDYDAPRKTEEESPAESVEALQASRSGGAQTAVIDVEENDTAEGIDLPGADLSGEELTVVVVPEQSDEFTCSSCFLVRHRSQVAREKNGHKYCRDCEG